MSQLYIRVKTGFYTHRKTIRLMNLIGKDAYWVPVRLWSYCAENQPDGNLSSYTPQEMAMLIAYDKDACSMLEALKSCGFIDSDMTIHGWFEHNGYHKKYSDRAKTAALARWSGKESVPHTPPKKDSKKKEESGDKHCISIASSINGSFSKPSIEEIRFHALKIGLSEPESERFFHFYESNGWRVGKVSMKSWHSAMAGWKLRSQSYNSPSNSQTSLPLSDAELVRRAT